MNGILIFNKPKGISSHDVVYILRKKMKIKKIGHTGTLDPIATGVLIMCIGKATKISQYIMSDTKEYIAKISFGYETATLDSTSEPIKKTDYIPPINEFKNILNSFIGNIEQIPPMYSAIKVNGQKLYELARQGKTIELKKRKITVYNIELLKQVDYKSYYIKIKCSSGTYIRSLIRDIGYSLNSLATMEELTRTKSGEFTIENSISEDKFLSLDNEEIENFIIPIDKALYKYNYYNINDNFYKKLINGVPYKTKLDFKNNELLRIYCKNEFIGIGKYIDSFDFNGIKMEKMLMGD
ncbi:MULTISPECIES: tRNA pseudouridine(55) synthase TruB [Peptoniphilus]|uniref:tRNA pseudouridine(55) synthase TruB n=1 Tax=Peptoniphilus TaxID=162289 RepID=UPI0001DA9CEF|nr:MULTISPECIES: tRNA pseudouridine(55) synthase TruB [Peptoniphilus]EFI42275.1 tRNA pseudouridine synthase B [Peptoniphilus sp. oral taxon 386 str. F0131]